MVEFINADPLYEYDEFPRFSIEADEQTLDELELIWRTHPEIYYEDIRSSFVLMYRNNGDEKRAQELQNYYDQLAEQPDWGKMFWLHDLLFKKVSFQNEWWWELGY